MIQKTQPIQFGLSPNEAAFSLVSAESLFALEEFRAMQKLLPNTVPDFFDTSYAELAFHSSEKPQILSC